MTTSKETPANATAKIASGRKRRFHLIANVGIGLLVVNVFLLLLHHSNAIHTLHAGTQVLQLEVVTTPAARQKGLSGRAPLQTDHAMLFVFEAGKASCFWMKYMHFSLDMIWLDSHKRITTIATHVAPNTYPQTFCPAAPSTYVIELSAGKANELGLATGQVLRF